MSILLCKRLLFINIILSMKYLLTFVCLFVFTLSAYDNRIAYELGYMSFVAYNSVDSINAWNCPQCSKFKCTDVQAYLNTTREMQGFVAYSPSNNAIIIAFKGSTNIPNWLADLDMVKVNYPKCSGCSVHEGFYNGWIELSVSIKGHVTALVAKYKGAAIYMTGHSLGGSLAAAAAPDILQAFGRVDAYYTFGQPRLGNEAHAAWFKTILPNAYRVIHYGDIVPHIPTQSIGYHNFNYEIWYTKDMQTYQQCIAEDPKCSNSIPSILLNAADHSLEIYLKMPSDIYVPAVPQDKFIPISLEELQILINEQEKSHITSEK